MPITEIITDTLIKRSPSEVFEFVTTPANWPMWHPSSVAVRGPGADHSALVGEEITEDFRVAGRSGTVTWRVIERIEPNSWAIEGVIQGRSNGGVVRYQLAPTGSGTAFTRTFSYPTPGALFTFLDRLFVRRRVKAESADAVRRLRKLLESK
ncbi:MAG TPA: SRPBCC family protein [Acidimicrobiia bacterium]|nr:SRPBCC family protein [Acidimicrobiia bacterium]